MGVQFFSALCHLPWIAISAPFGSFILWPWVGVSHSQAENSLSWRLSGDPAHLWNGLSVSSFSSRSVPENSDTALASDSQIYLVYLETVWSAQILLPSSTYKLSKHLTGASIGSANAFHSQGSGCCVTSKAWKTFVSSILSSFLVV